jgi:DnaJ-class molecular chaperone
MNIKQAFQIFDLDAKSSPAEIKQRYYDLAAVWHPDLHASSPRLQELASEKMKEVNSAYETIRLYLKNHITVACHYCGANIRKPADVNID